MPPGDVTTLLLQWRDGHPHALDQLIPLVYVELRRIASLHLAREPRDPSLQSADLVNETYLKLIDQRHAHFQNRAHFFAVASQLIRRILVDHARARHRAKRGGGALTLALDPALLPAPAKHLELVALDDALHALARLDPQQARVVELRFFGGLSLEETAEVLALSRATAHRYWVTARAWLMRELGAPQPPVVSKSISGSQ